MFDPTTSFLFTPSFEVAKSSNPTIPKILVSTLTRSLFSGSIHVFCNHEMPLFKVERRQIEEVFVPVAGRMKPGANEWSKSREFLLGLEKHVTPEPRQWIVVTEAAGLALRNNDHLIPTDSKAADAPAEVDFYWTKTMGRKESDGEVSDSPGLWAVRGEYLPMVLEKWKSTWSEVGKGAMLDDAAVWTRVVRWWRGKRVRRRRSRR